MSIPFDNWHIHPSAHIPVLLGRKWMVFESLNIWVGTSDKQPTPLQRRPGKGHEISCAVHPHMYAPWGRIGVHSIHWKLVQTCNMIDAITPRSHDRSSIQGRVTMWRCDSFALDLSWIFKRCICEDLAVLPAWMRHRKQTTQDHWNCQQLCSKVTNKSYSSASNMQFIPQKCH